MSYKDLAGVAPFHDDFIGDSNYLRILFNPGRAVQARELTQAQTILQNQVSKFGNHIFNEGSSVLDAKITVDTEKTCIELNSLDAGATAIIIDDTWVGQSLVGISSGATATIDNYDSTNNILFINFTSGEFTDSEEVSITGGVQANNVVITDTGSKIFGTLAHVSKGIVYVNSHFVIIESQTIIVEPKNVSTTHKIGYTIVESVSTTADDSTLNDPANGSYNFNAPGADRYKITLNLDSYESAETPDNNFISIVEIVSGEITKQQKLVDYSVILDTLARRTYDESGNYSVDVFNVKVADHATDADKLAVIVDPGKAYVLGYEVESVSPSTVNIDRSRTSVSKLNAISLTHYGPYTEVDYITTTNVNGTLDIDSKEAVELMSGINGTGDTLGSGRILSIQNEGGKLRLYISGLDKYESIFSSVRSIRSSATIGNYMNIELYDGVPLLSGKDTKPLIFSNPNEYIANIDDNSTTYEVTRTGTIVISGGSAVITAGANEVFVSSPVMYITSVDGAFEASSGYSAVILGEDLTISGLPDASYSITYRITKQNTNGKTKTLTQGTMSSVSTDANGEISLSHVDVYDIVSVFEDPAGANTDVTENAILDSGQNDYFYDYGKLSGLTPSATHTITYLYFAHGGLGDYFDVESYTSPAANATTINPQTGLVYGDFYGYIPTYTSTLGINYNLRDSFDFRRSVSEVSTDLLIPSDTITTDYSYYIPRIDKVYVDPYGNFGTITGVPELIADHPKEPDGVMVIATLYISPYTAFPEEVNIELKDTRRYTMEDIGELERRLENVEYYTAMNLLELNAKDLRITDKNGFDKFKNGILVDKFTGHDVGDVYNVDYRCAVDPVKEELRPAFLVDNVDLSHDAINSSNVTVHDNIVTKSYTTTPIISQLLASETINVNPYNVFIWEGTIKLSPSIDNWVDTTRLPDLLVNEDDSNANWAAARKEAAAFGTQWSWWRTNWVGVSRRTLTTTRTSGWGWGGGGGVTRTTSQRTITNTRRGQTRFGTRMVVRPKTTRKNLGDNVVNTTIIPWIRSRVISYTATRMKPDTTIIAYFDGVDVSLDCTNLTTDSNGAMSGTFTIPANKFRTGERILRFADDITSNPTTSAEGTYVASGLRQHKRRTILSITKPELVRQTVSQSRVVTSVSSTSRLIARQTVWSDPIAESFLIDKEGGVFISDIDIWFKSKPSTSGIPITLRIVENDNGYPSQVILPYSEVTLNPVSVTTTGNETSPETATKFTFSDPVYLQDAVEYSFMLISNSNEYEVYIGKIGDNKIGTTNRIDKQPYAGVMFKSQNSSTWTADQERDIMFEINRCVFDTGVPSVYATELDVSSFTSPALVTTNMFDIENITPDASSLVLTYQYLGDNGITFENKEDVDLSALKTLTSAGGANQLHVAGTMTTTKDNLSPVISLDSSSSVVVATELSTDSIVSPNDGVSYKIAGTYITRSTNLANPSDDLKVLLDTNKPSGTDVAVYFKTGTYEPRYVPVTNGEEQTSFDEETVYFYYDTTASNVVSQETSALVSQVDITNDRYYLKSIADSSKLVDPAGLAGQTIFACLINDITFLETWNVATAYTVGQHVWEAGLLYENITNDTGTTPGTDIDIWLLIPSTTITNALVVDAEQTWREMTAETVESADEFDFVETTFKPKEAIIDEFSSFSIKIELLTNNEVSYPRCKSMRSVAVY